MPTLKKLWFYPGIDSGKTVDPTGVRYGKAIRADMHIVGYYGDWRERNLGVFARKGGNAKYLLYVHGFDCIARTTNNDYRTQTIPDKTFSLSDFLYWSAYGPKSAFAADVAAANANSFVAPVNGATINIDDGSGTDGQATQTVAGGRVTALTLTAAGTGYANNGFFPLAQSGMGKITGVGGGGAIASIEVADAGGDYDARHNYIPWDHASQIREDANLFLTYSSGKRFWKYLETSGDFHYCEVLAKPDLIVNILASTLDSWLETAYPPTGTTYATDGKGNPRSPYGVFIDNASKVLRPVPFGGQSIENAGYTTSPLLNGKMRTFLTNFKASSAITRRNDAAHTPTGGTQGNYKVILNIASGLNSDGSIFAEEATLALTDGYMIEYFLINSANEHIPYGDSGAALDQCTGIDWQIKAAFRWSDKDILLSNNFYDGDPERNLYLAAAYYLVATPRTYCAFYAAGLSAAPGKTAPVYFPEIEYDLGEPVESGENSDGHIVLDNATENKQIIYRQQGDGNVGRLYRREFERGVVLLNVSAERTFVYRNVKVPPKSGRIILKSGAAGRVKPKPATAARQIVEAGRRKR